MEKNSPIKLGFIDKDKNIIKLNKKVLIALFIFIFAKLVFYSSISTAHMLKYLILTIYAVATTFTVEFLYYTIYKKTSLHETLDILKVTNPYILGLAIACTINYGYGITAIVVSIAMASILCRLFYGGSRNNIFNALSFTMIIMRTCFSKTVTSTTLKNTLDMKLLSFFDAENISRIKDFSNLKHIFTLETLPYVSTLSLFFVLITLTYFAFVIKMLGGETAIFTRTSLFLLILCYSFVGFLNGTSHIKADTTFLGSFSEYAINSPGFIGHFYKSLLLFLYMMFGSTTPGLVFGTVLTNTMPKSNVGKYIVAFLLALVTFYTKIFTYNPFGIFYAIILANSITPIIDSVFPNTETVKNYTVIILVLSSIIIGFIAFSFAMRGV